MQIILIILPVIILIAFIAYFDYRCALAERASKMEECKAALVNGICQYIDNHLACTLLYYPHKFSSHRTEITNEELQQDIKDHFLS